MKEVWEDIPGYEDFYKASSKGRIRSIPKSYRGGGLRGIILTPFIKKGYFYVNLSKKGVRHRKAVARLVAAAFICNPYNKPTVNHIDGNKLNNVLNNLEWTTFAENSRHAYSTGLAFQKTGQDNPASKLNNLQVRQIKKKIINKETNKSIAAQFGVVNSLISQIKTGKIWTTVNL